MLNLVLELEPVIDKLMIVAGDIGRDLVAVVAFIRFKIQLFLIS